jgi:2-polyprenyl-6-methoxyphenol hydroxylase-like FAD-dependent oxidoreductase
MLLARRGHRVLLVDRAAFPSDTLSTHYIHQPGVARLERWGLLDEVVASGCPPVRRQTFDVGPFALTGTPPPSGGVAEGYAPRRTVLDKILIDAAAAAGVEVREHFTVEDLVRDGDRVVGIRGRERRGAVVTERAPVVIGADGRNSFVAREVGAPAYNVEPARTCAYYSYWSGFTPDIVELYPRPERMIITAATNDDRALVIVYYPAAEFDLVRRDVEGSFLRAVDIVPSLGDRVRAADRVDRIFGTADLPFFFRRPYGPGWVLVGDAGYHKDPITAQGITDAFRDAELVADALDDVLRGRRPFDDVLGEYEALRNEAVMPMYGFTQELAALAPPSEDMQRLFAALRDDQEQTDRFLGTVAGTVVIGEFFSPENVGRILGAPVGAPV